MFSPLSLCCRNELERQFLELLQFNINVPSSVYAKYYFDLRSLAEANNLSFPLEPLSRDRAYKLEVRHFLFRLLAAEFWELWHCFPLSHVFLNVAMRLEYHMPQFS